MIRHLVLRLEAPLVAFGDTLVDAFGPVRDTPSTALLTGLLGNALGIRREETHRLGGLQERLVFASRLDRRAGRFTEFQTVALGKDDKGWTTRGRPEGRSGNSYNGPHIRYRDFDADVSAVVVLRLEPAAEQPDLDALATALQTPARPLFLGRKSCLPTAPLFAGFVEAADLLAALEQVALARRSLCQVQVVLPATAPRPETFQPLHVCDRRDWVAGVHTGDTVLYTGLLPCHRFPAPEETAP